MVFKRKLLSSSIALAIAGQTAPVLAEDSNAGEAMMEEVIVKGIRGSIQRSMDVKRNANGVVDAISAEEMGKFPDANLAESLQRITGVSISRSRGEGSQITVRGFGPEYNLVTLKGRQMPTHYGASRSFDFGDLASEGVAGVQVYKTGRADVPTGGVGSTINISMPEPLKAQPTASIAAKMVQDTSTRTGDDITPEFSGIYIGRFAEDTLGIAITASNQVRNNGVNAASTGGWFTRAGDDASIVVNDANQVNRPQTAGEFYSIPQSMAYNIAEFESERNNGQIVLQWAPSDDIMATLDYVHSNFTLERSYSDMSAWFSNTNATSQSSTWGQSGIHYTPEIYSEVVPNADFAMGTGEDSRENTNSSIGLNIEWQATDDLVLAFDHHDSSAETGAMDGNGTSSLITMASFNKVGQSIITGSEMPVMVLNLNSGGEANRPLYASDMVITGSTFGNDAAYMDIEQSKLSGNYNIDDSSNIDFGIQVTEVSNRSVSSNVQLDNWGGLTPPGSLTDAVVRSSIDGQFDELSGSDHPELQTEFFSASLADLQAAGEAYYAATGKDYAGTGDCGTGYCASTDWGNDIRTTEESLSAYIQLNWSGEIADMPANFRAGVRYEETDVTSAAKSVLYDSTVWLAPGEEVLVLPAEDADGNLIQGFEDIEATYDLMLPSLDLDVEVLEDIVLRFSYSETITRPSYNDIKGGLSVSGRVQYRTNTIPGAFAGNPSLVPIQSDNIDLSLEWYYGADSYFSLGYFEKDVKNFIGTGLEDVPIFDIPNVIGGQLWEDAKAAGGYADTDYGAIGNYIIENNADSPAVNTDVSPAEIYGQAGDPALIWRLTRPVNQREAAVDGVEINLQHTFGDTGFGFIANATFANADIGYDVSKPEEGQFVLNGLSDSANLIAFYDKNDLQVRLAYNWRDDFLAGAGQGQGTNTNPTNVEAYGQLDLGITYRATDNLTVYFSGINITEETVHVYGLTKDQVLQAVQGGPRYDLGIRYEFN